MSTVNFRTSSLFHYTSLNSLKKILKGGIIPNFCREDFSVDNSEYVVGIPMVSFCDIPLMRANVFTSRYGEHAIGLSKEWAIRKKINPILYISNKDIIDSLKFYKSYERHLSTQMPNLDSANALHVNLYDKESVSSIATFINHANSLNANLNFFGYAKKYTGNDSKGNEQCNYEENEWRYIVKESRKTGVNWKWTEEEYVLWRGDKKKAKPEPTPALKAEKLTFEVSDITHILVQYERQIPDIIDFVGKLTLVGGTDNEITDEERKILFSKIISMEKITKDF